MPFQSGPRKAGEALGLVKDELLSRWQDVAGGLAGQTLRHEGPVNALLNFANGGGLGGSDETGAVSAGPNGFNLQRYIPGKRDENGRSVVDWSLEVNPAARSASVRKGDVSIGGNWDPQNPSAFIQAGPVSLAGGRGVAPGGGGPAAPGYGPVNQTPLPQPGGWARVGVQIGQQPMLLDEGVAMAKSRDATGMAAQKWWANEAPDQPVIQEPQIPSARDELERQLGIYRKDNPYWYRP